MFNRSPLARWGRRKVQQEVSSEEYPVERTGTDSREEGEAHVGDYRVETPELSQ